MRSTFVILLALLMTCSLAWGQNIISTVTPNTINPGYVGNLSVTGSGTNFSISTAGLNVKLTHVGTGQNYTFGTAPGGGAWSPGYNGMPATTAGGNISLPGNAPTGQYNVTVMGYSGFTWALNNQVTGASLLSVVTPPNIGHFNGRVILDLDSNCVLGGTEVGLPNILVYGNPGGYVTSTDANGNFSLNMPMGTYTISVLAPGKNFVCPSTPNTLSATVSTSGGTASGLNFYLKDDYHLDLTTNLSVGPHMPGFTNCQWWVQAVNNTGTPSPNTVLKVAKPSFINFGTFSMPPSSIVGDTAYWNLGTLPGNSTVAITGGSNVPVGTWGNAYVYYSTVTTSGIDTYPYNNSQSVTNTIVGSYDPNDKQVWVHSTGHNADGFVEPTDSVFRYLIRFQNTGTAPAYNITVRDTFDTDWDMTTLRVTSSSHNYVLNIPDSTGRRIHFVFPNIMLADSFTNEPASHGYIQYTVRKRNGLPLGTVLSNRASIYFDFNPPVLTNTVNSTICPSITDTFTMSVTGLQVMFAGPTNGGANTWAWDYGDGTTGTGQSSTHLYAAPGTYTACLTVGNACGRSEQVCYTITVNCAVLTPGINWVPGTGNTIQFTNASSPGGNVVLWDFGQGSTSTNSSATITYPQPGLYSVCLWVNDACGDQDSLCIQVPVGCTAAPAAAFSSTIALDSVAFSNTSTGVGLSWAWDFGDGATSSAPNPSHIYTTTGVHNVCLTVTDACGSAATICHTVFITCAAPVADYSFTTAQLQCFFTDLSSNAPTAWAWDFGDGSTSTLRNPNHTYAQQGQYTVCLTTDNACGTGTQCMPVTVSLVGVQAPAPMELQLSPNPSQGLVKLTFGMQQAANATVHLQDALGRTLQAWELAQITDGQVLELDLSALSNGIYFLRGSMDGYQTTVRVVLQR